MKGDVIWDSISDLDFYLTAGSTLTGAVIDDESDASSASSTGGSGSCNLYVSKDSTWTVTEDSTLTALSSEGKIVDADGKTVSIVGTDGTVYVQGDSAYKVTVSSYFASCDLANAGTASSWSEHEVSFEINKQAQTTPRAGPNSRHGDFFGSSSGS